MRAGIGRGREVGTQAALKLAIQIFPLKSEYSEIGKEICNASI
jgi:hypothetical protein